MTIDISKIKPGDKVTLVPLEVIEGGSAFGIPCIKVGGSSDYAWITPDQIAAHHPAPREFQVGDRVHTGGRDVLTIIATDGDEAWVKSTTGRNFTAGIEDLTLVEGGE